MAFLFARVCHPAMRHAAPIRAELRIRSIFNMLGPLTNPARPEYQVVGVGAAEMLPFVAGALADLGVERALVVHGGDGLDEISLSAETRALVVEGGETRERTIEASEFGLPSHPREAVVADSVERSAEMVRDVLSGRPGAPLDFVLANAAAVLWTAGVATDLRAGVEMAREAADTGAAAQVLERLVAVTSGGVA